MTSFTSTKILNKRQVRWSKELSQYNFIIRYQKGSENGKADSLSQRSDYQRNSEAKTAALLAQQSNRDLILIYQISAIL